MLLKNILTFCLFLVLYQGVHAQKANPKGNKIYDLILNNAGLNHSTYLVYGCSFIVAREFDFKKIDLSQIKSSKRLKWKSFLNTTQSNKQGGNCSITNNDKPYLAYSNLLFSKDKHLAVCSVFNYRDMNDADSFVYLLEWVNGEWRIASKYALGMG